MSPNNVLMIIWQHNDESDTANRVFVATWRWLSGYVTLCSCQGPDQIPVDSQSKLLTASSDQVYPPPDGIHNAKGMTNMATNIKNVQTQQNRALNNLYSNYYYTWT